MTREIVKRRERAIDGMITTMGQIAMIDNAAEPFEQQAADDVESKLADVTNDFDELFGSTVTANVDSDMLRTMESYLHMGIDPIAGQYMVKEILREFVEKRRKELVKRLNENAKVIANKKVVVVPYVDGAIFRGSTGYKEKYMADLEPIAADVPFHMSTFYRGTSTITHPYAASLQSYERRKHRNYTGYSMRGWQEQRGPGYRMLHSVSLVNKQGARQVDIFPG